MSAGLLAMMVENWQSNSRDWVTMQVKGSLGVLERKTEFISSTLSSPPLLWKSRSCHSTQKGSAVLTLATQGYLSFGEQPESGLRGVTSYMKRSTPDWQPILRSVLSLLDSEGTRRTWAGKQERVRVNTMFRYNTSSLSMWAKLMR